ncbi:MAG: hypothetical protein ACI9G1_002243 [Pirellulaceae bacterium]|jgi:hypothetical protein
MGWFVSDKDWYFAHGDQEKGPITLNQLSELLANGTLQGRDLVWHDGMDDWAAVESLPELKVGSVVPNPPAPPPMPSSASASPESTESVPQVQAESRIQRSQSRASNDLLSSVKMIAQPLLVIGLLTVVFTRGCDLVGDRYADRLQARSQLAVTEFQDDWDQRQLALDQEAASIREKENLTPNDRAQLQVITEDLAELNSSRNRAQAKLRNTTWRHMEIDARDAKLNNAMWRFWRSILFIFGTFFLTAGLLVMGLSRQAAEKWLALVMLAIILFSIYVGSGGW